MSALQQSIVDELEDAISHGSSERRIDTLRRITDLFLEQSDRLNDIQIGLFDDVLGHFVERIESRTLAELSNRLAPVDNAPIDLIRRLARHNEVSVAGPVLAESSRLTTADLVEIAQTRGEEHLLAISGRSALNERVTDVLLVRGSNDVRHKVATNAGSEISAVGFAALVRASERDERLAEATGLRVDLPPQLLRDLLARAAESVHRKLIANAPVHIRDEVKRALSDVAAQVDAESVKARSYSSAQKFVELLHQSGELDEATLLGFARDRKYEETLVALAMMSDSTVDIVKPLMQSRRSDGLLVPCRGAALTWQTVKAVLACRLMPALSEDELVRIEAEFNKLTAQSAKRLLRFWKVRESTARSAAE